MYYCPKCKKCSLQAIPVKKTSITIERCSECGGHWFDAGELDKILDDLAIKGLAVSKDCQESRRNCPKCAIPMFSFKYPQTYATIEMCKKCKGIWLDAMELEEIQIVRKTLKRKGELETVADPEGVKGAILKAINSAIDSLLSM